MGMFNVVHVDLLYIVYGTTKQYLISFSLKNHFLTMSPCSVELNNKSFP